jgi:hypothetical protein
VLGLFLVVYMRGGLFLSLDSVYSSELSKFFCFIKLKHLIFINERSICVAAFFSLDSVFRESRACQTHAVRAHRAREIIGIAVPEESRGMHLPLELHRSIVSHGAQPGARL